jgi:S-adenosyl methyltransferase
MSRDPDDNRFGPRRSDPNHPSAARIYDYVLGGEYHYEVDRLAAEQVIEREPFAPMLARYGRSWVERVVRYLVTECGIRQLLDIGAGIPATGHVHEIAQQLVPTARVVYVDYERVAVDIGLEILEDNPYAAFLHADMRQPDTIMKDPTTTSALDFTEPVAVIFNQLLHFIDDQDDPMGIIDRYKVLLKSGDYIALSHLTWHFVNDHQVEQTRRGLNVYNEHVKESLSVRDLDSIMRFFDGTELVDPGVVPLPEWKPDSPDYDTDYRTSGRTMLVGGIARLV